MWSGSYRVTISAIFKAQLQPQPGYWVCGSTLRYFQENIQLQYRMSVCVVFFVIVGVTGKRPVNVMDSKKIL